MSTKRDLTSIDLFSGAGGLTEGLREAGFKSLYANEIMAQYAQTFADNHPGVMVDARDIRTVDASEIRKQLGIERGELDLVAGGPPCQGFSINAPKRSSEDERNHLFLEFLRFVEEFEPRAVLIENVPGLISFEKGKTLGAIIEALGNLGYGADVRVLYAPNFGVPQTRWRTIIIGVRAADAPPEIFPNPTRIAPRRVNFTSTWNGKALVQPAPISLPTHTTVRDAIGDLPPLESGKDYPEYGDYPMEPQTEYQARLRVGSAGVTNHEAPRLAAINLKRFEYIPVGGNWTDIPDELLPAGMKKARRSDHTKRYGRVDPDGLSSTILTKCDPHWGAYIHYSQQRSFTVREAARFQSFPDSYKFSGSRVEQFAQVGNAVPVMLGEAVGRTLASYLRSV
ncbi:DNA (cytosine-5-)-methyltransferase [Corynebacterium flavescens]|uniref:DNA (cytosine-5-)-methyltransferase n=1 Tax=Corynebacterium flavescens TaxID=28028 RepID=UPI000ECA7C0C|nr:DNA (cytosine-5-)-methyltransferase [Corynebacterium flavescens]